jgi:hypothetical protein
MTRSSEIRFFSAHVLAIHRWRKWGKIMPMTSFDKSGGREQPDVPRNDVADDRAARDRLGTDLRRQQFDG